MVMPTWESSHVEIMIDQLRASWVTELITKSEQLLFLTAATNKSVTFNFKNTMGHYWTYDKKRE